MTPTVKSERFGDWMETFTGLKFWPLDPKSEEVCIEDIAHALSMICRFGGHCKSFYSVAQHSCLVAEVLTKCPIFCKEDVILGLMHDAAEAYTGDIIRPVKISNPAIASAEDKVWEAIANKFGLPIKLTPIVKWADRVMLRNEHAQLMNGRNEWPSCDFVSGPEIYIRCWTSELAERKFIEKFDRWSK